MQIKYSEIANSSFLEILEFLEKNWTPKEINIFLDDVEIVLKSLVEGKKSNTKNLNPKPEAH